MRFVVPISAFAIGVATLASTAYAGSAAPVPLAGAGLLPFVVGGAGAVAWIAARALGKRLKDRTPRD